MDAEFQKAWEEYEAQRQKLVEANSNLLGVVLREKETRLDQFLTELKKEYAESCGGRIAYDIPVLTDAGLHESRLYRFCSQMPKGGDLHVHAMAMLPARELIALLRECPEFCVNADRRSFDLVEADPQSPAPEGYLRVSEALETGFYTEEDLIVNWTVLGAQQAGMDVWSFFEQLFSRQRALSKNMAFVEKYYDRAFRYYCRHNVQHVEIHMMMPDDMDRSVTYLETLRRVYYAVKKDYPAFTVKVIGAGVKADSEDMQKTKKCFLHTTCVQERVKDGSDPAEETDFVIGFDLVNEEDSSLPLRAFAPMLLQAKRQYPEMRFFIHGGESLDAGNENLIDAYLLGVCRVGHGLNLYRYPDLHRKYVDSEICLEVCPISNQALGYTRDIRNHPATEYLRTGVAVALCSDDPAYMENETLTDDFFAAVVGWNLSLADLKQLAINSIVYSGLSSRGRTKALKDFGRLWDAFVDRMLEQGL